MFADQQYKVLTQLPMHPSVGFNPMWNESFRFLVHVPELAMVRFLVEDYDSTSQNDLVGQYCLPLTSVQNGTLPLFTEGNQALRPHY